MKRLLILSVVLSLVGCASVHDRHDKFYSAIEKVAQEQREADQAKLDAKIALVKALFAPTYTVTAPAGSATAVVNRATIQPVQNDLMKLFAVMLIFNGNDDPRRLQYALERIPAPAPTVGERVTDGVFRVLPTALGIAAGAFAIDTVRRAAEGASAFAAGAGSTSVTNQTSTTNNYKYQSDNTQNATASMNGRGGGPGAGGGGSVSDSGNQAIGIGQQQNFDGGPVAFGSDSFQAPYTLPETSGPVVPVGVQ